MQVEPALRRRRGAVETPLRGHAGRRPGDRTGKESNALASNRIRTKSGTIKVAVKGEPFYRY